MKASRKTLFAFLPFIVAILFTIPIERADSEFLSTLEIDCGRTGAYLTFENPIERALMKGVVVTHSAGDFVYASSYTLLGIPLSKIEANCKIGQVRRL